MPKLIILVCLVTAGIWFFTRSPSPETIIAQTEYQDHQTLYRESVYATEWAETSRSFSGQVQQLAREYNKYLPMNTHNLVLTTGDYSNPERVQITSLSKGRIHWRYQNPPPEGSIHILHLIPANRHILKQLISLEPGSEHTFVGKEEIDNRVTSDHYVYTGGSKGNGHYLFFLTEIN